MPIKLNSTGGGAVSLTAPSTANTYTVTMLAATGTMVLDSATQTLTNKTLTSPTLATPNINSAQFATVSGTAPIYPCRAWVNFNGTGTVAIRGSGNVSSITDNGTGDYTANFTTAMSDANYEPCCNSGYVGDWRLNGRPTSASACQLIARNGSNSPTDVDVLGVVIFR